MYHVVSNQVHCLAMLYCESSKQELSDLHGWLQGRSLVTSHRPVNKVQVEVVCLKLLHGLQAVFSDLGVVCVPELGGQPEVLAADLAALVQFLKRLAQTSLILVCLGAIDVPEVDTEVSVTSRGSELLTERLSRHEWKM